VSSLLRGAVPTKLTVMCDSAGRLRAERFDYASRSEQRWTDAVGDLPDRAQCRLRAGA